MKDELALGAVVERTKKRHALNVVPMKMGNENMRGKRPLGEFALQFMSQYAKAGAAIEDVDLISDAHFYARGVAPVTQVLGLRSGRRAAHSPKLDAHKLLLVRCGSHVPRECSRSAARKLADLSVFNPHSGRKDTDSPRDIPILAIDRHLKKVTKVWARRARLAG